MNMLLLVLQHLCLPQNQLDGRPASPLVYHHAFLLVSRQAFRALLNQLDPLLASLLNLADCRLAGQHNQLGNHLCSLVSLRANRLSSPADSHLASQL